MGEQWFVVQTHANAERIAHRNIQALGFWCHFAQFVRMRRMMRHGRPVMANGKPVEEESIRPLFPGYLFVRFDPDVPGWGGIMRTGGVVRLFSMMTSGGLGYRPTPIPDAVVEHWIGQGREGDGVIDDRKPAFAPIMSNEVVRIAQGYLAGHEGICQMSDGDRIKVLLDVMGRQVSVSVGRAQVEKIDQVCAS